MRVSLLPGQKLRALKYALMEQGRRSAWIDIVSSAACAPTRVASSRRVVDLPIPGSPRRTSARYPASSASCCAPIPLDRKGYVGSVRNPPSERSIDPVRGTQKRCHGNVIFQPSRLRYSEGPSPCQHFSREFGPPRPDCRQPSPLRFRWCCERAPRSARLRTRSSCLD